MLTIAYTLKLHFLIIFIIKIEWFIELTIIICMWKIN